ncbi:MAG: hypothetical protein AAGD06_20380 [Acidobacteriota bacterium]
MTLRRPAGVLLAAVLLSFAVPAGAVDNYANAQFRPLHSAECIYPWQGRLIKQFDLFDGQNYPPDQTFYVVRHMGEPGSAELLGEIANPVTWDVGIYSGLSFPAHLRRYYQRGYRNDPVNGASAFQLACRSAGFLINTFQFNHSSGRVECPGFPDCLGGPQSTVFRAFGTPQPVFRTPSSELTLQVYAKLPWAHWNSNPAVGQMYLYAYLQDRTTGSLLAWLVGIYDSRPWGVGNGTAFVAHDNITSFVSSPLSNTLSNGSPNPYATKSPYSAQAHNLYQYSGEKFFRAHLKQSQLLTILADVNVNRANRGDPLVSENPLDWELHTVGVAAEVGWPNGDASTEISMGGSWRYFEAYEAYEVPQNGSRALPLHGPEVGTALEGPASLERP